MLFSLEKFLPCKLKQNIHLMNVVSIVVVATEVQQKFFNSIPHGTAIKILHGPWLSVTTTHVIAVKIHVVLIAKVSSMQILECCIFGLSYPWARALLYNCCNQYLLVIIINEGNANDATKPSRLNSIIVSWYHIIESQNVFSMNYAKTSHLDGVFVPEYSSDNRICLFLKWWWFCLSLTSTNDCDRSV